MAPQPNDNRSTWTDERLDDLNENVRDGFARLDSRLDSLHRALIIGLFGLTSTLVAAIAATLIKL